MAHGFTVQGGLGAGGSAILHDSSDHSVLVPDAELLFTAQFHRAGPDLVLTGRDGAHHLIPGYFSSEHHPALVAPNGAHLSADTVDLLAGSPTPGHYAQAQPTAPPDAIGKIEKVVGDVSVVRNGVSVALHVGDAVFKSDVVQTGASSSCGISFPDGTALNLVANTRMALNDYAFDASSNSNGALFTLVEGTFAFVAGKVAHQGDMKIATPVATMGIRGTTGVVEEQSNPPTTITANAADHTYTFAVVPDFGTGITGMWDVFLTDANGVIQRDANGNPIVLVTVSQSGYVTYLTPQGFGQPPLVETLPVTNLQFAVQTRMLRDLADTLNLGNPNNGNNGGSSTPPPFQLPNPSPQLQEDKDTQVIIKAAMDSGSSTVGQAESGSRPNTPTQTAHWQYATDGSWSNPLDWSDAFAPFLWQNIVIGFAVTVTIDSTTSDSGPTATAVDNLTIGAGATLDIVSGGSLVVSGTLDDFGLVKVNSTGVDPTLTLNGPVVVEVGGEIEALGSLATVYFAADVVDNFGKIVADNYGQVILEPGTVVTNEVGGQIEATDYGVLTFDQTSIDNFGTIGANNFGQVYFKPGAAVTNEVGGLIVAENYGTVLLDTGKTVKNFGTLEAATGGTLTLDDNIANHGQVLVQDGGTVVLVNDTVTGGQINLSSTDSATDLEIAGTVTLTGGTVTLSDNTQNAIVSNGAAAELINYDSISGAGTIGDGKLTLDNFATIDATDASPLTLDTGANAIINEATGILEASSGSTLDIKSDVTNEGQVIAQLGAIVGLSSAVITGGIVTIDGVLDSTGKSAIEGAVITVGVGGTLESTSGTLTVDQSSLDNGGELLATSGGTLVLDELTVTNTAGTVEADAASTLDLETTTISGGTVAVDGLLDSTGASAIDGVEIPVGESGMLEGVVVSIGASGILEVTSGTLTIGPGSINNSGLLEANGGTLEIDGTSVTNTGTLKATDNSTLALNGETVTNGGTVEVDVGSTLDMESATIVGGIVAIFGLLDTTGACAINDAAITNTGTIEISALSSLTIDPSTITNTGGTITVDGTLTLTDSTVTGAGTITVADHATVTLNGATIKGGTITDSGALSVIASSEIENATVNGGGDLTVASGQTLTLSGDTLDGVTLAGTFTNADTLTIDDTVTLNGATINGGTIGNSGTIDVTAASTIAGVTLDVGAVTVGNGVTLTLDGDTVSGTVFNDTASEATLAVDASTSVTLTGVTVHGGALTIGSAGAVNIENGSTTLDGVSVTNNGTINVDAKSISATLILDDNSTITGGTLTIGSSGVLDVEHGGNGPNHGATLHGVSVTDNGALDIGDLGSGAILTLDGGTTVLINNGTLTINAGSVLDVDGGITTIEFLSNSILPTSPPLTNNGILEASSGGTLNIAIPINNTSGILEATSGGLLDVHTAIGGGSAIIMGGTLEFDASSSVHVNFDNTNGYGELILGNPERFSGQISGFAGTAPDAADSDQVELLNFTETGYSVQHIGGNQILTLHDANGDVVKLTFDNFSGTLNVSTSGGKTFIYDPPAEDAKADSSTPATAVGDDHAAAPTTDTAHSSNQSLSVPATGSYNTASGTAFALSVDAESGLSPADPHNKLSTGLASSSGDNDLVDLSKIDGRQTFVGAVNPAEHGSDNVAGPVPNPPAVGDEHGHVTSAMLNPPALGGEHIVDSPAAGSPTGVSADADVGSLQNENGSSAAFTQTALSSLLNMLTGDHAMPGSDHGMVSTVQTALEGGYATASTIGTQSSFTSALVADNFVFHPNLGEDTIHNTSAHAADAGSISGQNNSSGVSVSVPELVPEIMFDPAHHDAADVSASVSQFQQMAASAHLLH